jgi:hypothetical protein
LGVKAAFAGSCRSTKSNVIPAKAVMISLDTHARAQATQALAEFRRAFHASLTRRADALFELTDAVLCADGPVMSLPELSLVGVHRRGHGALYQALRRGRIEVARLRVTLAGLPLPRRGDGQLMVAVDVTPWPRPDAECSPQRLHCHRPCRCDGRRQTIPGWPYSVIAALEPGRGSWTAPLDAMRIGPDDDVTELTATQLRDLTQRLTAVGHWQAGDPPLLVVLDSGYDVVRLTWLLRDLPLRLLGRVRADRVLYGPAGVRRGQHPGRPPRHGARFCLADPATRPPTDQQTSSHHDRYGQVTVCAWGQLHPKLERRAGWAGHHGPLPIIPATVLHVAVERLPGDRAPKPLWLWSSHPAVTLGDLDQLWHAYLRRFDLEHTFRFLKQTLGLTRPRPRHPDQADRWVWLLLAAYTQLRLARSLTRDLRHPWQRPCASGALTPTRIRRGFRRIRRTIGIPASPPKPSRPGPGRPKGRTSTPAPRYPVGIQQHKPDTPQARNTRQKR